MYRSDEETEAFDAIATPMFITLMGIVILGILFSGF